MVDGTAAGHRRGLRAGSVRACADKRPAGELDGDQNGHRGGGGTAGHRQAARRAREQLRVSGDLGGDRADPRDAACRLGTGARHDHVPPRRAARGTAAAASVPHAAGGRRLRSTGSRAAHRQRVGICLPQPGQRSGRQRRRTDQRHHRTREQGTAAQAGRLGRPACLGVGREPGARLLRNRRCGRREACGDRRRLAIRQGGARHDGVRHPVRGRAHRIVRRGRHEAAPAQLRRGGGEPHRKRRVSLDGRQLPQVRRRGGLVRQQERGRSPRGLAPVDCVVRSAPGPHQPWSAGERRRPLAGPPGQLYGRRGGRTCVPFAGREGPGYVRRLPEGEDAGGERRDARGAACLAPARRRAHRRPQLEILHPLGRKELEKGSGGPLFVYHGTGSSNGPAGSPDPS